MTDHEEISYLRQKVKELQEQNHVLEHNVSAVVAELQTIEGVLRRGMPVHPDYLKDLREKLACSIINYSFA